MTSTGTSPRTTGSSTRPLVAFVLLAYGISWAWAVPSALAGAVVEPGQGWPTHYPALLGPAIAAVVVVGWTQGRAGLAELGRRLVRWRVAPRWWLVAISPVAYLALALLGLLVAGRDLPVVDDFGRFSGTPALGLIGVILLIVAVGSLGEEVGWRGYALPRLQERHTALTATLILGVVWFAWHLPQFFVIATYRALTPIEYVGMFLGLLSGAVVLTWLHNRSGGSLLLVVLWHGIYNVVGGTEAATGLVAAVISTLIMVQAVVLVWLEVRARRRGRSSVLGPTT